MGSGPAKGTLDDLQPSKSFQNDPDAWDIVKQGILSRKKEFAQVLKELRKHLCRPSNHRSSWKVCHRQIPNTAQLVSPSTQQIKPGRLLALVVVVQVLAAKQIITAKAQSK